MLHNPLIAEDEVLRPTHLEIDLSVIGENLKIIAEAVKGKKIMPILKANAYGHGLIAVAKYLDRYHLPYFGVAYLEEAIMMRKQGITTPILVLGGLVGDQIPLFIKNDLTITASSIDKLRQIDHHAALMNTKAKVHLKIDTGMERIGIHYYNADKLIEASLHCQNISIDGIFTHFANADSADLSFTHIQLKRFREVLSIYDKKKLKRPMSHIGNSGAILQIPDELLDMVRPGILLYGVYPDSKTPRKIRVTPAMTWKTKVVYFKVVQPDQPVSYGGTWKASRMTRIVTLPIGYGDGYFRSMSNKAKVLIRGKKYPVIGNICMDQMMVDIAWDEAFNGEEVVLLGTQKGDTISVDELSNWAGTIPYEILTNINTRVPRVYVNSDEI